MATKATVAAKLSLLRRGLNEVEAAVYLSLSPTKFRQMVEIGSMPRPRLAGRRRIWDVEELDIAFHELPREGGDDADVGSNSWADYA